MPVVCLASTRPLRVKSIYEETDFIQQKVVLVVSWSHLHKDILLAVKSSADDEVIFSEVALSYSVSLSLHLK
ncbi:hypothetical protein INR49_018613 [Caranx melampygus]|nr:hypothetical protein INR49_018613 [Caranx melampygus]